MTVEQLRRFLEAFPGEARVCVLASADDADVLGEVRSLVVHHGWDEVPIVTLIADEDDVVEEPEDAPARHLRVVR